MNQFLAETRSRENSNSTDDRFTYQYYDVLVCLTRLLSMLVVVMSRDANVTRKDVDFLFLRVYRTRLCSSLLHDNNGASHHMIPGSRVTIAIQLR